MPKGGGGLNVLIFKQFSKLGILGKGKELTFFVLDCNYLVTIISLVDRKGFHLEMLYGRRISKNHEYRK